VHNLLLFIVIICFELRWDFCRC